MSMDRNSRLFIDTERVIAAVRARPNIWLPADENYKNKRQRAHAWTAVCHQVLDHFDQYSDEDQRELEKRVQQRWRTARDCFVKARMRPAAAAGGAAGGAGGAGGALGGTTDAQYVFMEQLTFLEPSLRHKRPLLSVHKHQLALEDKIRKSKRGKQEPAAQAQALAQDEGGMSALECSMLGVLKRTRSPLEDDDESFFRSLAPTLATLDSRHKLLFRSRVLATAIDVQAQCTGVFLETPAQTCGDANLQEDPPEQKYHPPRPDAAAAMDDMDGGSENSSS